MSISPNLIIIFLLSIVMNTGCNNSNEFDSEIGHQQSESIVAGEKIFQIDEITCTDYEDCVNLNWIGGERIIYSVIDQLTTDGSDRTSNESEPKRMNTTSISGQGLVSVSKNQNNYFEATLTMESNSTLYKGVEPIPLPATQISYIFSFDEHGVIQKHSNPIDTNSSIDSSLLTYLFYLPSGDINLLRNGIVWSEPAQILVGNDKIENINTISRICGKYIVNGIECVLITHDFTAELNNKTEQQEIEFCLTGMAKIYFDIKRGQNIYASLECKRTSKSITRVTAKKSYYQELTFESFTQLYEK